MLFFFLPSPWQHHHRQPATTAPPLEPSCLGVSTPPTHWSHGCFFFFLWFPVRKPRAAASFFDSGQTIGPMEKSHPPSCSPRRPEQNPSTNFMIRHSRPPPRLRAISGEVGAPMEKQPPPLDSSPCPHQNPPKSFNLSLVESGCWGFWVSFFYCFDLLHLSLSLNLDLSCALFLDRPSVLMVEGGRIWGKGKGDGGLYFWFGLRHGWRRKRIRWSQFVGGGLSGLF